MSLIRGLTYSIAATFTAAVGICVVLAGAGPLSGSAVAAFFSDTLGRAILLACGAFLVLVGVHFIRMVSSMAAEGKHFVSRGDRGDIELTPRAVREFIEGILRIDIGLERFRIELEHTDDGIGVTIRTRLSGEAHVTEIGDRIQHVVSQLVPERTGIAVEYTRVVVGSIRSESTTSSSESGDPTPI
ncbi:hypothetical protein JW848_08950 [Candidatus Bipolaricaulota bacterium]|nr:hypothetical protein [Candidatus Bipolaricaulota bacterium]